MKKNLRFFKTVSLIVITVLVFSSKSHAQIDSSKAAFPFVMNIVLQDGTKLWGVLNKEDEQNISINDFNLGEINIAKKSAKAIERQKVDAPIILETVNGISYFGELVSSNASQLTIKTSSLGVVQIQSNSIAKIVLSGAYVNRRGNSWFANPNATRYFFAPSAVPLKKKEGYFQNAYLLANSASVGLTNNITVGGGVVIPLLFYVTPKISYKVAKNLYLGAGILFTQSFISEFNLSAGIGYGLITVGNEEHNFTIGSGYGYAKLEGDYKETAKPILTFNGMTRVAKKMSIVTENWLIPRAQYNEERLTIDPVSGEEYYENFPVKSNFYTLAGSLGLRLMPGVKTSVDFSVVGIKASPKSDYLFIPYLDFVYKFN